MTTTIGVLATLREWLPNVKLYPRAPRESGDPWAVEVDGELNRRLVEILRDAGAILEVYRHKGTVATVIRWWM